MFYHIALLELASDLPADFSRQIEDAAEKIRAECPDLLHFSITPDESGRGGGFTHGMITLFAHEDGHKYYQSAKAHDAFKAWFLPYVRRMAFFDTELR